MSSVNSTRGWKVFNVFNMLFMILFSVIILYPYLNVLAVSLNDNVKSLNIGLMLWPRSFTLMNFRALLSDKGIIRAVFVTIGRLGIGVPYGVFIVFITSYALSKKYLPGRRIIIFLFLIPTYIPAGLIPTYINFARLGLLNNPLVYILPAGFSLFLFVLLRTYMLGLPDSLEESAKIDGAGDYTIMTKIYMPLCMPIIATLVLFSLVGHWNDWVTTLYFLPNNRWNTLSYELRRVLMEQDRIAKLVQDAIMRGQVAQRSPGTTQGVKNAQIILTTLPIVLVYPFLQKYFIQGMLVGGVKE